MSTELTFREGVGLREALRDAFRSHTALAQVVYVQFEQHLNQIAEDDSYREIITMLILWAENNDKTTELIVGARRVNPGNSRLRNFEELYNYHQHQHHHSPLLPKCVLTPELKSKLVDTLMLLQALNDPAGRTVLMSGITQGVSSLQRKLDNPRLDLILILDQLDSLGPLTSGH